VESFKVSNDPEFAEKLEDIVGLYLKSPEHTLVLCYSIGVSRIVQLQFSTTRSKIVQDSSETEYYARAKLDYECSSNPLGPRIMRSAEIECIPAFKGKCLTAVVLECLFRWRRLEEMSGLLQIAGEQVKQRGASPKKLHPTTLNTMPRRKQELICNLNGGLHGQD
jgi:hypothetical protein